MNKLSSVRIPQQILSGESTGLKIFSNVDGFFSRLFFAHFLIFYNDEIQKSTINS